MKSPRSFRLSETARSLLRALKKHLGIDQIDVLELAIREKAKKEGITERDTE